MNHHRDNHNKKLVIIFLDIDGVLLPFDYRPPAGLLFPDRTMQALSDILVAIPDAKLVLSSTWRVRQEYIRSILEELNRFGFEYGGPLLSVNFYDVTNVHRHSTRQEEIYQWLVEHDTSTIAVKAWVALDDEDLVQGDENAAHASVFQGHAVLTDSHVGLTDRDAQTAITLLQKQQEQP